MTKNFEHLAPDYQRVLMDRVHSMLAYWGSDLRCRFANRAYVRWFGVEPADLVGTSIRDLLGPELFALNEPHIRAVLRGEEQTFERVVPGPDGIDRHSLATYIPDIVDGEVIGFIAEVTEVTKLKEVEEASRELFAQATEGIFIADREEHLTDVNEAGCRLLGYTRAEIVGKQIADMVLPTDLERLRQVLKSLFEGRAHAGEWVLRRKDDSVVPVGVTARVMSGGRLISFLRDISEHKRALDAEQAMSAELERRVAERTEQLRLLGADVEEVEERERRKIARDLHDDLGQTLAAARIRLAALCSDPREDVRRVAKGVDSLIDSANRSTRSLAAQLAPAILYELGLCPALEWLGEEIERIFGLQVTVVDDGQLKPLSHQARSILYRASRELLVNVARHARTECAVVEILRLGDRIVVRVSDAGVGFDPSLLAASPQRGLGLLSLRERLSFIGGTAEFKSVPGDGTIAELSTLLANEASLAAEPRP